MFWACRFTVVSLTYEQSIFNKMKILILSVLFALIVGKFYSKLKNANLLTNLKCSGHHFGDVDVHGTHSKEILLYRANSLLKRAENAIQQLNSKGKLDDVRIIEKDDSLVKKLVEQLNVAKTSADLDHIESELRGAEIRLLHELTRLGLNHFLFRRDLRQNLISKGNDLVKQAQNSIKKLSKVHNTREISFIKREEELIQKSIKQIQAETVTTNIIHLEQSLRLAELRLNYYLKQSEHSPKDQPSNQQLLKQILFQRAATLAKQANEIIKKLKLQKKDSEANFIENDETLVNKLAKEIEQIKPDLSLLQMEQKLTQAENRLSQKIGEALQLRNKRNVNSNLETQHYELLSITSMEKLSPEGEHELIIIVEEIENILVEIDIDVQGMKPHTRFGKEAQKILEHLLKKGENDFNDTLKKLEHF